MADKYGLQFAVVPIDGQATFTTPVPAAAQPLLFATPSRPNSRVEVLNIAVVASILMVDAADPITVDLVYYDASANAATTLLTGAAGAAGDLKAAGGLVANEAFTIWSGVQSLDPGDTIRAVFTITTPTTAGEGYTFIVTYRVKEWNGQ